MVCRSSTRDSVLTSKTNPAMKTTVVSSSSWRARHCCSRYRRCAKKPLGGSAGGACSSLGPRLDHRGQLAALVELADDVRPADERPPDEHLRDRRPARVLLDGI